MPSEWEGVKRVHSCVRACGVAEVARGEKAKGEVEGEEDRRGGRRRDPGSFACTGFVGRA
jgi:hypothetical protein